MLVGAREAVVLRAAARMAQRWPHLDVCAYDGFEGAERALRDVEAHDPDVILVGMGNPLQEQWIERAAAVSPSAVFMGVGALFDFMADAVPRAPDNLRKLKLEWAFRLAEEPRRLWRRYTLELVIIAATLIRASSSRSV
jgi:exopolysaccharide biosynthesis WecB/TagA/CpsF family protein